jgi:hypothetical protein
MPLQVKVLAEAAYLAAAADEPLDQNFVRKHALDYQAKTGCDLETAALRVYGNAEGAYGSNVNNLVESSRWGDEDELAETYKRPVAMHDCTGPFTLMAGIHLAINATNAVYQETVRAYLRVTYPDMVTEGITVEDGHILAPTRPGLGTALLPDFHTRPGATVVASAL